MAVDDLSGPASVGEHGDEVAPGSEWASELYRVATNQFDRAARAARARAGVRHPARSAAALDRRELPRPARRRPRARADRLSRPAHADDGADEGWLSLRPRRVARRVRGARDVDDLEMRAARAAVRRREGRRALLAGRSQPRRDRAPHAPLRRRADPRDRSREGHPRARHGNRRTRDGVVHGHVLADDGPLGVRDRHRQAGRARWHVRAARGDRPRRRVRDRGGLRADRDGPARGARRDPGLRQRRLGRGQGARRDRRARHRGVRRVNRPARPRRSRHRIGPALGRRARRARRLPRRRARRVGRGPRARVRDRHPGGARAADHRRQRGPAASARSSSRPPTARRPPTQR